MGRPLPKLDTGRRYSTVLPPMEDGTAFKQFGYHFNTQGECIESALTDAQRERHESGGPDESDLKGSKNFPPKVDLGAGAAASLDNIVRKAQQASGLSADGWNELDEKERDELINLQINELRAFLEPAVKSRTVGNTTQKVIEQPKEERKPEPPPSRSSGPKAPPAGDDEDDAHVQKRHVGAVKDEGLDLRAWVKGDATYRTMDVISTVKARFNVGVRSAADARKYLIEEQKYEG